MKFVLAMVFVGAVSGPASAQVTSTYTRVLVDEGRTIMSVGRDGNNKVMCLRVFEKQ